MNTASGSRSQREGSQQQYPGQARVYSLTLGGVDTEEGFAEVVTGTVHLFDSLACTLFDSGATYSFISSTYVKLCSINTQPLEQNVNVATPAGDVITCRKSVKDCPIIIRERTLPANLVVFQMLGFEIILGMDWLSRYYASIDCRKKEIIFRSPNEEEFIFHGSQVRVTLPLLSAFQASRSVRRGAPAFLAYVKAKPEVEKKLEGTLVVRDYPVVFAKISSGLPPDHEIEFTIDLLQGTQPIHKAPY